MSLEGNPTLSGLPSKRLSFAEDGSVEEAILADLYRRSGKFDQVAAICKQGIAKKPIAIIRQVLEYQIALASQQDKECHRIEEASK